MSQPHNWAQYLADNPQISIADLLRKVEAPALDILTTNDISGDIDTLYRDGRERGQATGWPSVDPFYRVAPGFWTCVTGWPGSGKSTWVDNLAVKTMEKHNWRWLFFSAENRPYAAHWAGLAEIYTGQAFDKDTPERMSSSSLEDAKSFLAEHCFHVRIDDDSLPIKRLLDVGRVAIERFGINCMVIDPWNEVEHSRPHGQNETEYVSTALSAVRSMARATNIHIFVVAHPAKGERKKDGTLPIPTLHDISGSAHFWNKSDYGICVHRDFKDRTGETHIVVQKARHRYVAQLGSVSLFHDRRNNRYVDPFERHVAKFMREPGCDDE